MALQSLHGLHVLSVYRGSPQRCCCANVDFMIRQLCYALFPVRRDSLARLHLFLDLHGMSGYSQQYQYHARVEASFEATIRKFPNLLTNCML